MAEIRLGDVIRYTPGKRISDDVYWCREGTAVVEDRDGTLVAYDTYWGTRDGLDRLTDGELASAEVLFNLADHDPIADKWRWERYAPADRQVITSQHRLQHRYFVRKGASEDLATQIENWKRRVEEAESDVESARRKLDWERRQLAELEARAAEVVTSNEAAV